MRQTGWPGGVFEDTASAIPEGCRIEGSPSGSVQAISYENGRQGYVIADVEWVSFQASE